MYPILKLPLSHCVNFLTWVQTWVGQCNAGVCLRTDMGVSYINEALQSNTFFMKLVNDLFSGQTSRSRTSVSSGVKRSVRDQKFVFVYCCRTITELYVNVDKIWSNHCDWLIKNGFIATSTNYSTHLCLIVPCFMLMKWADTLYVSLPILTDRFLMCKAHPHCSLSCEVRAQSVCTLTSGSTDRQTERWSEEYGLCPTQRCSAGWRGPV